MCRNAVTKKINGKSIYDKEICINSKNLFGTQVSMLNDRTAISCAFRELIEGNWQIGDNKRENEIPLKGKRGSCYTLTLDSGKTSKYFDFDNSNVRPVGSSDQSKWSTTGGIGPMGPNFLSLENRFVFSTPFARSTFSSTIAIYKICRLVFVTIDSDKKLYKRVQVIFKVFFGLLLY